jgi:outer membrane protein TolC
LTLADAVRNALQRNDRLVDMGDTVEQADLSVRLARNEFRPKITPNILGSFGQSDVRDQTYRIDVTQKLTIGTELRMVASTRTEKNQLGDYYSSDATLALTQPLLRGFGRHVARRQLTSAEVRHDEAMRQRTLSEQRVAVEVAGAYYRLVAQQRLTEVAEKSVERSRHLLEASQAKLTAGKVSQLDVFRAQQLLAQAESQLVDTQSAVEDARDELRFLMGEDAGFGFDVEPEIPEGGDLVSPEEAARVATRRRLELLGAQEAAEDAERAISFAKNQLLPQLDLSLALTRRETGDSFSSSLGLDGFEVATFVTISMPADRTRAAIEHHNALIERDRKRRQIRTLRTRIADEARRVARGLERLTRSLVAASTSVEFAGKELELAELRFQRGLSNNLDVVNAEGNVLAAESRRIAVLAELAVARLGLRATLGVLDPRAEFGWEPGAR